MTLRFGKSGFVTIIICVVVGLAYFAGWSIAGHAVILLFAPLAFLLTKDTPGFAGPPNLPSIIVFSVVASLIAALVTPSQMILGPIYSYRSLWNPMPADISSAHPYVQNMVLGDTFGAVVNSITVAWLVAKGQIARSSADLVIKAVSPMRRRTLALSLLIYIGGVAIASAPVRDGSPYRKAEHTLPFLTVVTLVVGYFLFAQLMKSQKGKEENG